MIAVVCDDGGLAVRLAAMARTIPEALAETARSLSRRLLDDVGAGLCGPALNTRSGALSRSVAAAVDAGPAGVEVRVSSGLAYSAFQDQGFSGTEQVAAHLRRISVVYGRPLATPVTAPVRASARRVDYAGRGFLSGPLAALAGDIVQDFDAALSKELRP